MKMHQNTKNVCPPRPYGPRIPHLRCKLFHVITRKKKKRNKNRKERKNGSKITPTECEKHFQIPMQSGIRGPEVCKLLKDFTTKPLLKIVFCTDVLQPELTGFKLSNKPSPCKYGKLRIHTWLFLWLLPLSPSLFHASPSCTLLPKSGTK